MVSDDLSPEYIAVLRRMTGAEKLRAAFDLNWTARKVKAARLRQLHPDWSDGQIEKRVKEIFLHAVT